MIDGLCGNFLNSENNEQSGTANDADFDDEESEGEMIDFLSICLEKSQLFH